MTVRMARRLDGVDRTLIRRIQDSAPEDAVNQDAVGEVEIDEEVVARELDRLAVGKEPGHVGAHHRELRLGAFG